MPDPSGRSDPLGSEATRAVVSYLKQNRESPGGALHAYMAERLGRTPEGADLVDGLTREPENTALQELVSRAMIRAVDQDGEFAGGLRNAVDRVHAEQPALAVPSARHPAETSVRVADAGSFAGGSKAHVASRRPAWLNPVAEFVQTRWFRLGASALIGLVFLLVIIFGR